MFLSEWREFPSAPCLAGKKNFETAPVLMLLKLRPSLTCFRACFLPARVKDYQHPGGCLTNVKTTIAWRSPSMTLVRASQRIWLEKIIKCRKAVGNSSKLYYSRPHVLHGIKTAVNRLARRRLLFRFWSSHLNCTQGTSFWVTVVASWQNTQADILNQLRYSFFWDVT